MKRDESSSLWGCELKSFMRLTLYITLCHPPCEDVSWKIFSSIKPMICCVILLVRMWVEKLSVQFVQSFRLVILLVRMWVEKYLTYWIFPPLHVILLVRMWVEKNPAELDYQDWVVILLVRFWVEHSMFAFFFRLSMCHPPCEDVSWKTSFYVYCAVFYRHPPCEDVSWKVAAKPGWKAPHVILLVRMWVENLSLRRIFQVPRSSSLWGCELKSTDSGQAKRCIKSSSLWGCELKK